MKKVIYPSVMIYMYFGRMKYILGQIQLIIYPNEHQQ